ncbi:MAG: SoxY-related AACIE arm protein [Burkholderiaceae bacterium]
MMDRRTILSLLAAIGMTPITRVWAKPSDAEAAIKDLVGNLPRQTGRIQLELAPLVENGNLVPIKCFVASPMTQADHVKVIHLIAEANPLPNIVSCYLSPLSGRAAFETRIRLADSQRVWAIAQMSDGSVWQTSVDTLVTLSACTEMI